MNPQQPGGGLPPLNRAPQPPSYGPTPPPQPVPIVTPNQAYPAQAPGADPHVTQQEHYDFILNPQKVRTSSPLTGGTPMKRAAIFGGGLVILVILGAIIFSMVGGGKNDYSTVVVVAEDQTELIRIAKLGTNSAVNTTAENLANNLVLSLTTAQQQTLAYLTTNHQKVGTKQLALKLSTSATTDLKNAVATSTFDSAFIDVVQADLNTYSQDLNAAYKANLGPKSRTLLQAQYKAAQLLLTESKQPDN